MTDRRQFLRCFAAGTVGSLAGCAGLSGSGGPVTATGSGRFGTAVATDGDRIAVGAPDAGENGRVAVYWSTNGGLEPDDRLTAPVDSFGERLALAGERLFVGSGGGDTVDGTTVRVYRSASQGWVREATLRADDHPLDGPIAATGTTVLVGATDGSGAVAFDGTGGWTRDGRLTASEPTGHAVALAGTTAVLADPGRPAFVFRRAADGWAQTAVLPRDGRPTTFGTAVAVTGQTAVVGAPEPAAGGGSVVTFQRTDDGWTETVTRAGGSGGLGATLAAADGVLVAGAPSDDLPATDAGEVHLFANPDDSWQPSTTLQPESVGENAQFGAAVDTDGQRAVVGAPGHADGGAVFLFDRDVLDE